VKRICLSKEDLTVLYCVILLFLLLSFLTDFSFLEKDREVAAFKIFWFDQKIF